MASIAKSAAGITKFAFNNTIGPTLSGVAGPFTACSKFVSKKFLIVLGENFRNACHADNLPKNDENPKLLPYLQNALVGDAAILRYVIKCRDQGKGFVKALVDVPFAAGRLLKEIFVKAPSAEDNKEGIWKGVDFAESVGKKVGDFFADENRFNKIKTWLSNASKIANATNTIGSILKFFGGLAWTGILKPIVGLVELLGRLGCTAWKFIQAGAAFWARLAISAILLVAYVSFVILAGSSAYVIGGLYKVGTSCFTNCADGGNRGLNTLFGDESKQPEKDTDQQTDRSSSSSSQVGAEASSQQTQDGKTALGDDGPKSRE